LCERFESTAQEQANFLASCALQVSGMKRTSEAVSPQRSLYAVKSNATSGHMPLDGKYLRLEGRLIAFKIFIGNTIKCILCFAHN
jgi:hypothetical protein